MDLIVYREATRTRRAFRAARRQARYPVYVYVQSGGPGGVRTALCQRFFSPSLRMTPLECHSHSPTTIWPRSNMFLLTLYNYNGINNAKGTEPEFSD
ncbi:hypothetical protein PUN28_003435 [Cardiocondyla obscurior]|uniref:Uncharacterized protein n=1 Tax=Cardiocondyla obscurior TaxID=286306 RepID=A0AAW2GMP3_9HYME